MSYHIYYNDREYTRLKILFSPEFTGAFFYKILELIEFPLSEKEDVLFRFAITELVTNAIRASKENKVEINVRIEFSIFNAELRVVVKDYGLGFDKSMLPFKINEVISDPQVFSEKFIKYREKHGNQRFGMGLLSAKMVMDEFSIDFFDKNGEGVEWKGEGSVMGTIIRGTKKIDLAEVAQRQDVARLRKSERFSLFVKIKVNDSKDAYLVDLSLDGAQILMFFNDGIEKDDEITLSIKGLDTHQKLPTIRASVQWMSEVHAIIQIGVKYIIDNDFPLKDLMNYIAQRNKNPFKISEMVYIEGS
ncbi:MAG: ATP-binding protein [Spirochaetales bacterium]|nr:ATP-binding protein [Spirochaetales bacterium]